MNHLSDKARKMIAGIVLLILSAAVIAAGAVLSARGHSSTVFLLCSIPAAVMIVWGGALAGPPLIRGEAHLLLTGGELTITAQVLGVTRNLRTKGEKTQYYIVCRHKDPVTGRTETYTSEPLDEYPGKEVIGRSVEVRIDPSEQGRYTVELGPLFEELAREREDRAQGAD